jgi:hypothetical protein
MIIKTKGISAKRRLYKFGLELPVSLYTPQLFSKNSGSSNVLYSSENISTHT